MFNATSIGNPKFIQTTHPFSFYQFSEKYYNSLPLKRIFSLMRKQNVKLLIEERIQPSGEFLQEIKSLEEKFSSKIIYNKLSRFTFFNIDIKKYNNNKLTNRN